MYRNLLTILLGCLICISAFLATFGGSSRQRADYIWNNQTEPQTLDPGVISGEPEGAIVHAVLEGLTSYHWVSLEPMPAVAKSWEIEGLTYTFHLRDDSYWVRGGEVFQVDGQKRRVTAHDFSYAWRRHFFPETGSEYNYLLHLIEGTQEYQEAVGRHWSGLVARYGRDHPNVAVVDPRSLETADREALERFRDEEWRRRVRVQAIDDLTLEVTLKSPAPYFLDLTAFPPLYPVPREVVEEHGREWVLPDNIVTNGPFVLEEWRFNSFLRMRKNRHYWETTSYAAQRLSKLGSIDHLRAEERRELDYFQSLGSFLERGLNVIDAFGIEEQNTSLNLYLNDDIDRIKELPPEVTGDLLEARDEFPMPHLHHNTSNAVYYYVINLELPVFSKGESGELGRKLRRALALCVDRQGIIDVVTRGHQKPAYRFVPPGIAGYSDTPLFSSGDFQQDVVEAKRLVAQVRAAGVKIPRIKVLYNTHESHAKIAAFVQGLWKRHLDIEIELTNQEWGVYLDAKRSGQFEVARMAWIGDYADPNTFLDMLSEGNPNNDSRYENPVYDRVVSKYCGYILEHLKTENTRKALLQDVSSWHAYDETVKTRVRPDGRTLDQTLREAIESYSSVGDNQKLDRAFGVRLLLFEVAEEMLMYDMPLIPFYFYTRTQLWPPELEGIATNARAIHPPKYLRWRDGERPTGTRYGSFPRLRAQLKTIEKK